MKKPKPRRRRKAETTQDYVRLIANAVGLKDWRVSIGSQQAEEGCYASVHIVEGQRNCEVRLASGFAQLPPEERRSTLLHEMLHCHAHGMAHVMDSLRDVVGVGAFIVASREHKQQEELMVEQLAVAFEKTLPLPKD